MEEQEEVPDVSVAANADNEDHNQTETGRDASEASQQWVDRIVADAGGDDEELLRLINEHLEVVATHARVIRDLRGAAIVRERRRGKSNRDLRLITGISDSQVARAAIRAGGDRRIDRRPGRP